MQRGHLRRLPRGGVSTVVCSCVNGPVVLGPAGPGQQTLRTPSWLVAEKGGKGLSAVNPLPCAQRWSLSTTWRGTREEQHPGRRHPAKWEGSGLALSHCFRTPTWVPLDRLQNPAVLCVARTHLCFCPPWEALLAQTPLPGLAPEGQGLFCAPFHQLCCYLTHLTAIPCRICLGAGSGLSELPAVSHQGDKESSTVPCWGRESLG